MSQIAKLSALSLAIALSIPEVSAHPLFSGKVVSRADLLPEYDYVVVGAGTSGLTVANRLTEQKNVNVLVIEAGDLDKNEDFVTIPGLAGGAAGTKYDWNVTYTANEGLGGRKVPIPQGKIVGGSSKLNRLIFDRGSKSDYDGWESLGNKGWNFAGLLPYFKKNEKFTPPTKEIAAQYDIKNDLKNHGDKGYMQTTFSPFFWPTTKNIVKATKALGIPINDQATGNAIGGFFCPHNQDPVTVTRSSADEAYYDTAVKRQNFHVITGQQVSRIVTKKSNGAVKVTGIEFASSASAKRQSVKVKQEAIIAAGALFTPQLLQVSGIGDPALLKTINVTTVVELPAVGHNLHDHVLLAVANTLNTTLITSGSLRSNATFAAEARKQYDTEKKGPLTSPTGDFLLFLPLQTYSNATSAIASQAKAGKASASLPSDTPPEVAKGYQAQYASLNEKLVAKDSAILEIIWGDGTVILGLQHPYSRGSVKAASSSVFDAPLADVGFLRNPIDVALLREGIHFARRLVKTEGITELKPVEVAPGANVTSDADLDAFIRRSSSTLFHPAGSCKMGPKDQGGVVDSELKVYGVEGLRIVDASVMPILPAAHTMTTVYAVAEKAADIIRGSAAYKAACLE
ncbi:GMC oxidoreductase [Cucurbitaria berberidis CBS 394.84]|uniref:GMC oxidoreductase n=1 Tax=Cucurbitaria berberidis CBS 394.84 TaxID=1168544 RepID=A0A9P4GCC2_9PLEO|nr:GMC oxidoreductase [Cucurbitaria berberidis CBS 394.84]KAF1842741.1 GMC oxidoreductase [Cucurbitaria berberidis CBS 394.84]